MRGGLENVTDLQFEAWGRYREARLKADRTLDIVDGIAAVRAYKEFYNLFVGEDRPLPLDPKPKNTVTFPVHKTRCPEGKIRPGR